MGHQRDEWNQRTIEVTGKNADSAASVANDQPTGEGHSQHRTDRRREKDQTNNAIVDAKLILNSGQTGKIIGMHKAVEEEDNFDSETGSRHRMILRAKIANPAVSIDMSTEALVWVGLPSVPSSLFFR